MSASKPARSDREQWSTRERVLRTDKRHRRAWTLNDATKDKRYDEDRKAKRSTRNRDRWERDEYEYSDSEDEFKSRPPKLLEAPSTAGANQADFIRDNERRHGEREAMPYNMSGGLGARDDRSREESRSRY